MRQPQRNRPPDTTSILQYIPKSGGFQERRKMARLGIPLAVTYRAMEKKRVLRKATTINVSAGGCLLLAPQRIEMGAGIDLVMPWGTRPESQKVTLKGKVLRLDSKKNDLFALGIVFDPLSPEALNLFTDFCFDRMHEITGQKT